MKYFLAVLLVIVSLEGFTQDVFDAVRVSSYQYSGTARFNAMGGAMGALGADYSVISTNPGGLGLFRKNEFNITPSVRTNRSSTDFNGYSSTENVAGFKLENIGLVINSPTDNEKGIIHWNWAFGYNRIATFDQDYRTQNSNMSSSLLDIYAYDLNYPTPIDPNTINEVGGLSFGPALGWNTYAIDYDTTYLDYYHANPGYEGTQSQSIEVSGALSEYNFAVSGNFNNDLFFGASLNYTVYNYQYRSRYREELPTPATYTDLESFEVVNRLNISGNTVRFKAGLVYRINDYMRMGIAYHAPTRFSNTDTYSTDMVTNFNTGESYNSESPDGQFLYTTRTPGRFLADLGIIVKKSGLIGIEYEFVNYSRATFNDSEGTYDYSYENEENSDQLQATHNFRVGGEYRWNYFSFRGGFRYQMSPFRNSATMSPILTYSTGVGFRFRNFYSDLTWMLTQQHRQNWMYDSAFIDPYTIQRNSATVMLTIGFRWQ